MDKDKKELLTPCLLLEIDAVDRNIERMASFFAGMDCKLRPHTKTHKLPLIARKQVRAGAIGITCAKVRDAKAFVEAGVEHILIANQVVGAKKIQQWVDMARSAEVIACVDSYENAHQISAVARKNGAVLDVLIEVDVGLGRCGVEPGLPTLEFLQGISKIKGVRFRGLMGFEGGLFIEDEQEKLQVCKQRNQVLVQTSRLIEEHGFEVEIASAGGANTYQVTGKCSGITEIQPGS